MTQDSPYRVFAASDWAHFSRSKLTLSEAELAALRGRGETVSLKEVEEIYLPLSRLISLYAEATQTLYDSAQEFLGEQLSEQNKVPFIIGIAGSVAVGKSTSARILQSLLARWQIKSSDKKMKVDLITTDGFLYPNAVLEERGIMNKKGFPESFDLKALRHFLALVKSGASGAVAPVYSHNSYDIVAGETSRIARPDILIVEGLNVLQPALLSPFKEDDDSQFDNEIPFVSDFFDFSIYIDAATQHIKNWYIERFMNLRATAFLEPSAYFHRYSKVSEEDARATADDLWTRINQANLYENILPTRGRANLILHKDENHSVDKVLLRKI